MAEPIVWTSDRVRRDMIATDPAFKTRRGSLCISHVKTLVAAIRRGGALSAVVLWRQEGRNSFVLLDGEHRLAAYRSAGWRGNIPARIVTCSRRTALLIAASANTRDAMPLTQTERADLAWRLVREPGCNFTKEEIARAAGVSERTVTTMRARWRTFQSTGGEPSGYWWQDRRESGGDDAPLSDMTEAERQAKIEDVAAKMRKAAGNLAFKDEQLFAEALDAAFGRHLRAAIDHLFAPEEVDEWAETFVGADDAPENDGDDPDF